MASDEGVKNTRCCICSSQ